MVGEDVVAENKTKDLLKDDDPTMNVMTPDAELARARHFLSGWTLSRYTARFKAEGSQSGAGGGDGGDGVTPPSGPGGGGGGWTPTGPPPSTSTPGDTKRCARRRPSGVLTIPTCATVGQALRDLAAADVLAAPAMDASTGDYAGWVSTGGIVQQLLRALYPALLNPELVAQDDLETTLWDESLACDGQPQSHFQCMAAFARSEAATAWSKIIRVGDDGDTCFLGFADTTLLDFVSRGLDARPLDEKRIGDFEPCHRIGVFTEPLHECVEPEDPLRPSAAAAAAAALAEGGADVLAEDEGGLEIHLADMRPRWVAVVSQLDVIDLMVRDADSLGAFPHVNTMERLGFATSWGVIQVTSELPVAACFAIMHNAQVSGVAVLDRASRFLIGSLSVSDIRHVDSPQKLDALSQPVGEFLRDRVWSETYGEPPKLPPGAEAAPGAAPPGSSEDPVLNGVWRARAVTVPPNAPLIAAMRAMSAGRVHRVYIADSPHSPPLGVCTCTDVMRIFAVDPEQAEGRARLTW